ncbi:MAG: nicotinate-nucleotide adenylyltransferase [Candidatus Zixiibacteriota bacterium]
MTTTPEKGENWGILGGTFDPVHTGHITLANDICIAKGLDGVLLVPAGNHPFKEGTIYASFEDRVQMLKLAVANHDCLGVSKIEQQNNLSGYTLDTIRAVKKRHPGVTFYFIIGADNISQIRNWHRFEKIFDEIHIVAGTRPSYTLDHHGDAVLSRIEFVETSAVNVSSSEIRQLIGQGGDLSVLDRWVGSEIKEYIIRRKLYR